MYPESNTVPMMTVKERLQWMGYGLIAGLLIGLILGWLFRDVISTGVKMLILAALLVPLFFAIRFWHRTTTDERDARTRTVASTEAIETQGGVVTERVEVIEAGER